MRAWKELLLPVSVAEIYRPGSGDSSAARWIPLSFFAKNVMMGVTFSYWILTTRVRNKKERSGSVWKTQRSSLCSGNGMSRL